MNRSASARSAPGRRIAYARFGFDGIGAQVRVARINGGHAHPPIAPRLEATQPNWSPDGSHIAFASNSDRPQSSIEVMTANGTAVTRLATTKWPTNNFLPAYSPDGTQIAFSSDRRHPGLCCEELFVMRADGSHQHLVDTGLQGVLGAAWAPRRRFQRTHFARGTHRPASDERAAAPQSLPSNGTGVSAPEGQA